MLVYKLLKEKVAKQTAPLKVILQSDSIEKPFI